MFKMAVGGVDSQPTISDPELKKREKARIEKLFPEKTRLTLAKLQIIFAAIAVVLQVILVAIDDGWQIALAGIGIWSALCFGITAGVGLVTTQRASRKSIKLFGVLSICSIILAMTLIGICMAGIRQSYRDGQPGKVSKNAKTHCSKSSFLSKNSTLISRENCRYFFL